MNKKYFSSKIVILIVAIAISGTFIFLFQGDMQYASYDGPPRAVIIDQLYSEMPNENFHIDATEYLQAAGYEVDIVTTKDITVDFYKNLPKMNYKYVVVRTHGAENTDDVVLFTGERYTEEKYISEQLLGQVKKAAPLLEITFKVNDDDSSNWIIVNDTYRYMKIPANPVEESNNEYFAISSNLVNAMNGKFDDTIFVLGGCNTLSNPSLAKSLTERGASMVLGWDNTVGNADNDFALLYFLKNSLTNNLDTDIVLEGLKNNLNPEYMAYPSTFTYYT